MVNNKDWVCWTSPRGQLVHLLAMGHILIPPTPDDAVIEAMARAMDHEIAGENFHDIPTRAMARAAYAALDE